ncbi:MAG: hypothetical protein ACHQ49_02590 [Elusimicrobiota bacterium]
MRARLAAALLLGLAAAPARGGIFGRSKLLSLWTAKSLAVEADDTGWDDSKAFDEDGFTVYAKNDGRDLYLLITGHTRESRDQLSGESHQDVSLWFVAADGKTRRWGARLPFSHRSPLTHALRDPAGVDPEPEEVEYAGAAISTGTMPDDVVDRLAAVGRRPLWEMKIPLKHLEIGPAGAVAVDFVVNAPVGGAKRRTVQSAPAAKNDDASDSAAASGGGRGRGKRGDSGPHAEEYVWDALSYSLSVRLAPDPASVPR